MRFKIDTNEPFDNVEKMVQLIQEKLNNGRKLFVTMTKPEHGFIDLREIGGTLDSVSHEDSNIFVEVTAVENKIGQHSLHFLKHLNRMVFNRNYFSLDVLTHLKL